MEREFQAFGKSGARVREGVTPWGPHQFAYHNEPDGPHVMWLPFERLCVLHFVRGGTSPKKKLRIVCWNDGPPRKLMYAHLASGWKSFGMGGVYIHTYMMMTTTTHQKKNQAHRFGTWLGITDQAKTWGFGTTRTASRRHGRHTPPTPKDSVNSSVEEEEEGRGRRTTPATIPGLFYRKGRWRDFEPFGPPGTHSNHHHQESGEGEKKKSPQKWRNNDILRKCGAYAVGVREKTPPSSADLQLRQGGVRIDHPSAQGIQIPSGKPMATHAGQRFVPLFGHFDRLLGHLGTLLHEHLNADVGDGVWEEEKGEEGEGEGGACTPHRW